MTAGLPRAALRAGLLALLQILAVSAWAMAGVPAQNNSSRIEREMAALCQRLAGPESEWFGDAVIVQLESQLSGVETDAARRAALLAQLGWHLVRLGDFERAIEVLEDGLEIVDRIDAASEPAAAQPTPLSVDPALRENLLAVLASANFLMAEQSNCVGLHNPGSCIVPVRESAVHRDKKWAEQASLLSERRAREFPSASARWLASLGRLLAGADLDARAEDLALPPSLRSSLVGEIAERPIGFWLESGARLGVEKHGAEDLSGGAIADDFDGDGRIDLVSSSWHPCSPLKAYRNTGSGFEDVTRQWHLDEQLGGLNLVQADYDGDGRLDLLVLRGAWQGGQGRVRNSLLRNTPGEGGRPSFDDVTHRTGLAQPAYPTQTAAWADYDLDGDLDLYVGNEGPDSATDPLLVPSGAGSYPSQLFRNDGGRFTDVARLLGVTNDRFAKGVAWGDVDDDGDPDLFVSNLGRNRLYINLGREGFVDQTEERGLGSENRTFATWFFDFDNDRDLDLFVGSYGATSEQVFAGYVEGKTEQSLAPLLYRNDGGRFVDVSKDAGLGRPLLTMGANHGDLDGDGFLDIYLGTGVPNFDALMPNVALHNVSRHDSKLASDSERRFVDVTFSSGLGHLQKGHGVAFADLDGDGLEDLFQQLGGAYPYDAYRNVVYLNPAEASVSSKETAGEPRSRRSIVVRLVGAALNARAVGARVTLGLVGSESGDESERQLHRQVDAGSSFGGSSHQLELAFLPGETPRYLEVRWPEPGAPTSRFDVPATGRVFEVSKERLVAVGD